MSDSKWIFEEIAKGRGRLRGAPLIVMMETPDFGDRDDRPGGCSKDRSVIWRVLLEAQVRSTPMIVPAAYLRLAGARMGRRVYVNSLSVSDYNLLKFGDDVGHRRRRAPVGAHGGGRRGQTAPVRLGRNVTIGLGSVIEISVEVGSNCQVGALSFVPKHSKLEAGSVYAGIPARRISAHSGISPDVS